MRTRAFTLIELLIVIAIIAVLIGLLLPALASGKAHAKMVQCMSNQRQIGYAQQSYADEFDEYIIREAGGWFCRRDDRHSMPWALAYRPYMDGFKNWDVIANDWFEDAPYFRDPARPDVDGHKIHYVNNGIGFERLDNGDIRDTRRYKPMHKRHVIQFPSDVYYLTGYAEDPDNRNYNNYYRFNATNWRIAIFYDVRRDFHVRENNPDVRIDPHRHGNGANVLFMDGHATFVRAEELTDETNWIDLDFRYKIPPDNPPSNPQRDCPPGS